MHTLLAAAAAARRIRALAVCCALFHAPAFAQTAEDTKGPSDEPGLFANLGPEYRARALQQGPISKAQPPAEHGYRRLGVVANEEADLQVVKVGVTLFTTTHEDVDDAWCFSGPRLGPLFAAAIDAHEAYEATDLGADYATVFQQLGRKGLRWVIRDTPEAQAMRKELHEEKGLDALVIVTEGSYDDRKVGHDDFIENTGESIGARGLYSRIKLRNYAYAGLGVIMIDLATGKQIDRATAGQASFWKMSKFEWTETFAEEPDSVREELCERLKRLDANNVAQALWQLRITDVQPPVTAPAL